MGTLNLKNLIKKKKTSDFLVFFYPLSETAFDADLLISSEIAA